MFLCKKLDNKGAMRIGYELRAVDFDNLVQVILGVGMVLAEPEGSGVFSLKKPS
jgi:hypothetical protein